MAYLFNNESYPIVTSEADIVGAYEEPITRAVILRNEVAWQREKEIFQSGIIVNDNPELGKQYWDDPNAEHKRKIAGNVSYTKVISASEVLAEAEKADIILTPDAYELFQQRMNGMRDLYQRVHDDVYGMKDEEVIVGHAMFTPKHGVGRAPMMHVDDVRMTMHTTFAGATLRLLDGITSDTLWELMDKRKSNALPEALRDKNDQELTLLTNRYCDEFGNAQKGEVIFMKGQKGMDLSDPADRQVMGVHASSHLIPFEGQAAAIFYSKDKKLLEEEQKTLDME